LRRSQTGMSADRIALAVAVVLAGLTVGVAFVHDRLSPSGVLPPKLVFVATGKISDQSMEFDEPSGLTFSATGSGLVSVSDNSGALYISSTEGKTLERIDLGKKMDGLEGVEQDRETGRILLVREDSTEIIEVWPDGRSAPARHPLAEMAGYAAIADAFANADSNDGLEGIALVPETGTIILAKEKNPRMLIEVTNDLRTIRGALYLSADLGFVGGKLDDSTLDVSGLAYDATRKAIWITSDTGERVFLFDPVTRRALWYPLFWMDQQQQRVLQNAEGVAVSEDGKRLFVVTDDGKDSRYVEYTID